MRVAAAALDAAMDEYALDFEVDGPEDEIERIGGALGAIGRDDLADAHAAFVTAGIEATFRVRSEEDFIERCVAELKRWH